MQEGGPGCGASSSRARRQSGLVGLEGALRWGTWVVRAATAGVDKTLQKEF